ncbi:Regulator of ribonuclease-like protein 2 [Hordeum vulgare]|nr:Regulator of ribonuclease-like protein 2 [Hordeum vulgare]
MSWPSPASRASTGFSREPIYRPSPSVALRPSLESATMAALPLAMTEVYDANSHLITGGELRALQPIFKIYGRRQVFTGPIVTLKVFEDNVVVREFLGEKG